MKNGRCRMHGGTNPGAPRGRDNGAYKHGLFTREAIERRRQLRALMQEARKLVEMV
ncbi:hypothetical protein [Beijerinckia sp. L45]|uniref:hypothetical protein n=1 Tax=Beijerinckia sp. L45 TaxID=1641855 RepID=UPI002738165B|nr:hypothetical protein [Beijerinckia sp. L45]